MPRVVKIMQRSIHFLALLPPKTRYYPAAPMATPSTSSLLFSVLTDGKEYRIYTNGRVDGFGTDVKIVNYFLRRYTDLLQEEQDSECSDQDTPEHMLRQDEVLSALPQD
jgi:hypothetical protein